MVEAFVDGKPNEIEQLQVKVAELEEEIDSLEADKAYFEIGCDELRAQLASAQAEIKLLLDALEVLAKLGNGDRYGNSEGNVIAQQALAQPSDTSALDAYVAEKVKEAGKFDIWRTNPYTKVLETSIKQLTRQRDLAVEALEKQGHSAGCRKNAFGDICTCGLDDLLSTIKESEAMAQGEKK